MSTQEPNEVAAEQALPCYPLEELRDKLFPEQWKTLPTAITQDGSVKFDDGTSGQVQAFMRRCKGEEPTEEEAKELIAKIAEAGEPVAWLVPLAYLSIPVFPEDKDPTVQEFFDGKFDPADLRTECVLVSYPCFRESN